MSSIVVFGELKSGNHLKNLGELVQVVSVFPCPQNHIVKEVSILRLAQTDPKLLKYTQKLCASDVEIPRLPHALKAETVQLLDLQLVRLQYREDPLEQGPRVQTTPIFELSLLSCLQVEAFDHGRRLGRGLSQVEGQFTHHIFTSYCSFLSARLDRQEVFESIV